MKYMITVGEAKEIIEQHVTPLPPVKLGLLQAAGCVLAENIFSIDQPSLPTAGFLLKTFSNMYVNKPNTTAAITASVILP